MATKISHEVQEYRPPPPYLGIILKKKQYFLVLPFQILHRVDLTIFCMLSMTVDLDGSFFLQTFLGSMEYPCWRYVSSTKPPHHQQVATNWCESGYLR